MLEKKIIFILNFLFALFLAKHFPSSLNGFGNVAEMDLWGMINEKEMELNKK